MSFKKAQKLLKYAYEHVTYYRVRYKREDNVCCGVNPAIVRKFASVRTKDHSIAYFKIL